MNDVAKQVSIVIVGASIVVLAEQLIAWAIRSVNPKAPHISQWGEW